MDSKCKKCDVIAVKEGLCRKHWIEKEEEVYLDNTNPDDLGIFKWARYMLKEFTPNSTPKIHIAMILLLLSFFDPFYINKMERQANIRSFRGSAKSTLLNTIFVLYLICHNGQKMKIKSVEGKIIEVKINEKFIAIISETGGSAEEFVVRARDELTMNERLKYFYQYELSDAMDDIVGQWTRRAFKYNGCFILGAGSGQQIRGRVKGAYRVSFMIFDDIYSENNTITPESRTKTKTWFNNAALNSVDDLIGKSLVVNTIVHEDTIPVQLADATNWKTMTFSVMPLEKFQKFIKEHLVIDDIRNVCKLPFEDELPAIGEFKVKQKQREYFAEVQKSYDWELAWSDRINLNFLALKYQEAMQKRALSSLYQEYFHQIVSEEQKQIKAEFFRRHPMTVEYRYGYTWLNCPEVFEKAQPVNIEIGLDFASGSSDGDDAVAVVAGVLPNNMKVVLEVIAGKMSKRDQIRGQTASGYGRVEMDKSKIDKIGLVDEAIRLAVKYKAKKIKVGYAGTEKANVQEVRQLVYLNGLYEIMVIGRRQDVSEGSKRLRILNNLSSEYETRNVIHQPGLDKLEYQLEFLKNSDLDDTADACFAAKTLIETNKGRIPIEKIKEGDMVLTPIGFCKVEAVSKRKAKVINKFGFVVTPNHKFYNKNSFSSIDSIEVPLYFSKANIKELLKWKYASLKYRILQKHHYQLPLMEWSSGSQGRANIISLRTKVIKDEKLLKDFTFTFGNMLMGCEFHLAIIFTIKTITHLIITLITLNLWKLKSILDTIGNITIKRMKSFSKSILVRLEKRLLNGIVALKVKNGIRNIMKDLSIGFIKLISMSIYVWNVVLNILIPKRVGNIALINAEQEQEKLNWYVPYVQKNFLKEKPLFQVKKDLSQDIAAELVLQKVDGGMEMGNLNEIIVYNIQVEKAGCYYANGILVSNCEVALWQMQKPFELDIGTYHTNQMKDRIRFKKNQVQLPTWDWRTN